MFATVECPPAEILRKPHKGPSAFASPTVLQHRNYRLFSIGQFISQMGNWINNVAQGWLVYYLTHSPLVLGITIFAGQHRRPSARKGVPILHLLDAIGAAVAFGNSLIAFSSSHWLAMWALMPLPTSFNLVLFGGSTNSLIQCSRALCDRALWG